MPGDRRAESKPRRFTAEASRRKVEGGRGVCSGGGGWFADAASLSVTRLLDLFSSFLLCFPASPLWLDTSGPSEGGEVRRAVSQDVVGGRAQISRRVTEQRSDEKGKNPG